MTGRQWIFWGACLAGVILFLVLFQTILLPFVVGFAFAYFLDPLTDKLESWKVPRGLAALMVLSVFTLLLITFLLALWPVVADQAADLLANLPRMVNQAVTTLLPWVEHLVSQFSALTGDEATGSEQAVGGLAREAGQWLINLLSKILSGGLALFNLLSLAFVMPIVAFFLLRDWDIIVGKVDSWLPRQYAPAIRRHAREIDRVLSGYLRGQGLVAIILAALYAVGWGLIGLDYALLLGLIGGLLSFIPFVGAAMTVVLALIVAAGQFWPDYVPLLLVGLVYIVVQTLEGNLITPKLVGGRVGLSPLWVIFALMAGGSLLGLLGVLLAVPVSAIVGVLMRSALDSYLHSGFFDRAETSCEKEDQ